jgi:hypothetical protein
MPSLQSCLVARVLSNAARRSLLFHFNQSVAWPAMSQNIPLSAFIMHFVSHIGLDINVDLTSEAPHLLKRQFPTIEHLINERTSGNDVIGYPGSEAQLPEQQTSALSK